MRPVIHMRPDIWEGSMSLYRTWNSGTSVLSAPYSNCHMKSQLLTCLLPLIKLSQYVGILMGALGLRSIALQQMTPRSPVSMKIEAPL